MCQTDIKPNKPGTVFITDKSGVYIRTRKGLVKTKIWGLPKPDSLVDTLSSSSQNSQ